MPIVAYRDRGPNRLVRLSGHRAESPADRELSSIKFD